MNQQNIYQYQSTKNQSFQKRIEYIDALRGFCMILVVYAHLALNSSVSDLFGNNIFLTFRMPLFFFLSGFLCFSRFTPYMLNKLKKRFLGQLLPTMIVGVLFVSLMAKGNFEDALFHKSKASYWFTFVALEIYFIYAFITFIIDKLSTSLLFKAFIYVTLAVLSLPLSYWIGKSGFNNSDISGLFSIVSVISYTPFFLFGVIAKMYKDKFINLIENKWIISIVIVSFCALHIIGNVYNLNIKLIFYGIIGVTLIFLIFHNFRDYFSCNTTLGKALSYIGKRTLPIYLTHYFFLGGIAPAVTIPLIQNYAGWITGFICYFILALLIIGICLIVEAVFRKAEPLYRICFGYPN